MSNLLTMKLSKRQLLFAALIPAIMIVVLAALRSDVFSAPDLNLEWDQPRHVSTGTVNGRSPVLVTAPNGTLLIAYDSQRPGGQYNPYFVRSTNGGASWTNPAPIRTAGATLDHVTVAYNSNSVAHAVWRSNSGLFHAQQSQWPSGSTHTIVSTSDRISEPYLTIGPDNVLHVVWAQNATGLPHKIYHAYSTNGGTTWSSPTELSDDTLHSRVPVIAVDQSNNIHVAWEEIVPDVGQPDFFRYEIHYKRGTKSGSSYNWQGSATVISAGIPRAQSPAILSEGNSIHVGFGRQVVDPSRPDFYLQFPMYRKFTPGSGWSAPLDISRNKPLVVHTDSPFWLLTTMVNCEGSVYIYFHGSRETNAKERIWGATNGDNWGAMDIATSDQDRSVNPSLVCHGGGLHIAFELVGAGNDDNKQIYYTRSGNANQVFLSIITR